MNDEYFLNEDDPDLWNCIDISLSQEDNVCDTLTPELHCLGQDSWKADIFKKSLFRNYIFGKKPEISNDDNFTLCKHAYSFNFEECCDPCVVNFLLNDACNQIQDLMENINGNFNKQNSVHKTAYLCRHRVTVLLCLINRISNTQWTYFRKHVARLRILINKCTSSDVLQCIYNVPKNCGSSSFHMMHGALEWKILDLCLLHKNEPLKSLNDIEHPFYTQLNRIIDDLITCSIYAYKNLKTSDLLCTTPFPCTCFREIWILLQLAVPKWFLLFQLEDENAVTFWKLYNTAMDRLKLKLDILLLNEMQYYEFNNWLMNALTQLHGYKVDGSFEGSSCSQIQDKHTVNYEAYQHCVQNFLQLNPSEEHLRVFIGLLEPILLDWSQAKIEIPTLLWEYFHKRLNINFYTTSKQALMRSSADAFLKHYKLLLTDSDKSSDECSNSFTQFTLLISKLIRRLCMFQQQHIVQKLLGRIYIKFSPQKFLTLNEFGIYQLSELFIAIALCDNSQELLPKIREKLLLITIEKINLKRQLAIVKTHMVMLILHAERGLDISEYVCKLFQQLNVIAFNIDIYRIVYSSLWAIFSQTRDFKCGVHLLINKWLPHFLNKCTDLDREKCLETLYLIFCRMNEESDNYLLFGVLFEQVLPFVKIKYISSISKWLPLLAADFCMQSYLLQDDASVKKLISYFVESQTFNAETTLQFVLHLYERSKQNLLTDAQIIQVWLKSVILMGSTNLKVTKLTTYVTQLKLWKTLSNLQVEEFISSNELLTHWINAVAMMYENNQTYEQRCLFADSFNNLLKNFENWIPAEKLLNAQLEVSIRFYSFIAIVISNCSNFVYVKSKITCFFHVALTRFILTTDIQIGKTPNKKHAQIIHKIWSPIVQGIARLNYRNDSYIEKTLNDLILKWVPHFKISTDARLVASPFVACLKFENEDFIIFLCEKLASFFLLTERRQAHINSCLVIVLFQEGLSDIINKDNRNILQSKSQLYNFINGIGFHLFEHIMMIDDIVPSRSMALDFIRRLTSCNFYIVSPGLRLILEDHLKLITHKHLAYHTYYYFDLLNQLATIDKKIVLDIWDILMNEILVVEEKRGVGKDQRMREHVNKLQTILKKL